MASAMGISAILLWGVLALLGTMTSSIPAFQLLALCFSLSASLMVAKRVVMKQPLLTLPTLTACQWLFGIAGLFGFHFCYFMAIKFAPAIEVSLIVYLWPLLLTVFVVSRNQLVQALLGGTLGFVGIAFIIVGDGELALNGSYMKGYALSMCCALIWSSFSWYLSTSNNDVDDIGWLSAAVALLSFAAHFSLEQGHWGFSWREVVGVVLLGLGPVGGAFYLWDVGMKRGNRQLLASLSFSTPLLSSFALSLAGLVDWSLNLVVAVVLVTLGAIVSNYKSKSERADAVEALSQ